MAFTEKQQEFLNNADHRWNIKSGATRSGKTYLDYFVIPKRIRAVSGKEGLNVILGNTKGTIQRNIIEPLQNIWGNNLVGNIRSDNTAIIFGERVYCLGASKKNQVDVIRGMAIKYCYGDEVVTWCKEVFDMVKSRLDKPYSKFDGTCNPDNPKHWFKEFLESDADIYLQEYCIDDNSYLDKTFVAELKKEYAGTVLYDRFILGLWKIAEGLVFQNFSEERTVIDFKENYKPASYYVSIDYGITNPFIALVWRVEDRQAIVINRYYYDSKENGETRRTDEEHYAGMEEVAKNYPVTDIVIDPSATSFKETIDRHGKYEFINANNNVLQGISNSIMLLNTDYVKIDRSVTELIEEFGLYRWNDKSKKDEVIKENDHCSDAFRYFVNTILRHEFDFMQWGKV